MLDKTREIVRDILTTAAGDGMPAAPLIDFSGISGNGHTFNLHITAGPVPPCLQWGEGQRTEEAPSCFSARRRKTNLQPRAPRR